MRQILHLDDDEDSDEEPAKSSKAGSKSSSRKRTAKKSTARITTKAGDDDEDDHEDQRKRFVGDDGNDDFQSPGKADEAVSTSKRIKKRNTPGEEETLFFGVGFNVPELVREYNVNAANESTNLRYKWDKINHDEIRSMSLLKFKPNITWQPEYLETTDVAERALLLYHQLLHNNITGVGKANLYIRIIATRDEDLQQRFSKMTQEDDRPEAEFLRQITEEALAYGDGSIKKAHQKMNKAIRNAGGDLPPYKDKEDDDDYTPPSEDEDEGEPPEAMMLKPQEYARYRKTAGKSSDEPVSRRQTRSGSARSAKQSHKAASDDDLQMPDADKAEESGAEMSDDDRSSNSSFKTATGESRDGGDEEGVVQGEKTPASKHPASPQVHPESEERKAKKSKTSADVYAVLRGDGDPMEIESPSPDQLRGSLGRINPAQRAGRNVDDTYLTREPVENLMDFGRPEWEDGSDGEEIR